MTEKKLLNRIVARDDVLAEAIKVAAQMAGYPPSGVTTIKRLMREGIGKDQISQMRAEMDEAQRIMASRSTNLVTESYRDFVADK